MLPLRGLTFAPSTPAADWLLSALGAVPAQPGACDLTPELVDPVGSDRWSAGLPPGCMDYATGLALAIASLAGRAASGVAVATQIRLPQVMAAAYGSSFEMRPPQPIAVAGGWVHADLGSPGDAELFEQARAGLSPTATSRQVAEEAQAWRLPVCDYRPRPQVAGPIPPWRFGAGGGGTTQNQPWRVLDLTNMWAGPLATWLLQDLGAVVTKVEPSFRPDGLRALAGGGIYPGGRPCRAGEDSAMWNALNSGKAVVDLDLRSGPDRTRFLEMAAASDVVIESFSPRVMPNFGLDLPAGPLYVSMPAFPPGPRRDWVAYGSGIHAVSGLGDTGDGRFAAPAVSYPDAVAGFTAALGILAALTGRRRGVDPERMEVSLADAVQPLVSGPWCAEGLNYSSLLHNNADQPGSALLARALSLGLLEERDVCGRPLPHPRTVFPSKQNVF
ncbi:MAG: CoA transferase [Actinomycetota bacterium]|nr:CoA transferase [Actinomycetota bacterium]